MCQEYLGRRKIEGPASNRIMLHPATVLAIALAFTREGGSGVPVTYDGLYIE